MIYRKRHSSPCRLVLGSSHYFSSQTAKHSSLTTPSTIAFPRPCPLLTLTRSASYSHLQMLPEMVKTPFALAFLLLANSLGVQSFSTIHPFSFARDLSSLPLHSTSSSKVDVGTPTSKEEEKKESNLFDWTKQWYPMLPLTYLQNANNDSEPLALTVLGKKLVIWKGDDEAWSVMQDACPHRSSPLSTGKVVKSDDGGSRCLQCRFHGFEFDTKGTCTKVPMDPKKQQRSYPFRAASYPTRLAGGMLWAFLDDEYDDATPLPEIPADSIYSDQEAENVDWTLIINPISFVSMVENAFDPTHASFNHEAMRGLSGQDWTPDDTLPMEKYQLLNRTATGLVLEHTPFQKSIVDAVGPDSVTQRRFIAPCLVGTWIPPPVSFEACFWFVPSTPKDTNVIMAVPKQPPSKWLKWARRFPSIHRILEDSLHSKFYMSDMTYRFLAQDRITMQGQDEFKSSAGGTWLEDVTPTPADNGVAVFQNWVRTFGQGGPFPEAQSNTAGAAVYTGPFSREISTWDSHAKFCPQCQRTKTRMVALEKLSNRLRNGSLVVSAALALGASVASLLTRRLRLVAASLSLTLAFLVTSAVCHLLAQWACSLQKRMFGKGDELWQKNMKVFYYPENGWF